jgi:hypothetical protein
MTCRKHKDDVKTGVESLPRDQRWGDPLTASVASGMKVARVRSWLEHGTWEPSATRGGSLSFRDRPPPTGGAMKNDFIEGDEWDAYVALDTFSANGTRDGLTGASPRVTESS